MCNSSKLLFVFITFFLFSFNIINENEIEKVYVKLESRQVQSGKSVTLQSEIFYKQNGELVTHFISPKEYIILSNKQGEVKLYDPLQNTVIVQQSNFFSSQTSQLYYFLNGRSSDMGLADLGFVPSKTYPEQNFIISLWSLKVQNKKVPVQQIKLVHQNQKPIYMDYRDANNKIIRKVFYSAYTQLYKTSFPTVTTDIIYNSPTDSTVTKNIYSGFKLNDEAINTYFSFKIPASAKNIN